MHQIDAILMPQIQWRQDKLWKGEAIKYEMEAPIYWNIFGGKAEVSRWATAPLAPTWTAPEGRRVPTVYTTTRASSGTVIFFSEPFWLRVLCKKIFALNLLILSVTWQYRIIIIRYCHFFQRAILSASTLQENIILKFRPSSWPSLQNYVVFRGF